MCPYKEKHSGKSTEIRKDILDFLEDWEKKELENFERNRSSEQ